MKDRVRPPLDLDEVRRRLSGKTGPRYWRSLEEIARTEEFQDFLRHEFPENADQWGDPFSRRRFLQLMGASLALAGLAACARQPLEKIVPYADPPEDIVPGIPLYFATALPWRGYAMGAVVESHMGRPTKVEGNPRQSASLGGSDIFAQASVLTLYDPERSQVVNHEGTISTWESFVAALTVALEAQRVSHGAGLRILTGTVTSPTLAAQIQALLKSYPAARWHQFEPILRDSSREGIRLAFGADLDCQYRFDRADTILSLDGDFLFGGSGSVRYARDFASRRRVTGGRRAISRLYAVESSPGLAGAMADHRLPLRASQVEAFALTIARELGLDADPPGELSAQAARWAAAAAKDLEKHRGSGLVIAGEGQPARVHALAHGLNSALGNAGTTAVYTDPVEASPVLQLESLRALVADMDAGRVEVLAILGGNPVFSAPADFDFQKRLARVPMAVHLSLYEDETSEWCHWHVPTTHPLETWTDLKAFDGTVSICQPLIAPLYNGKSAHEMLAALSGQPDKSSHDLVKDNWRAQRPGTGFEDFWQTALNDGFVAGSALPQRAVTALPLSAPGRIQTEELTSSGGGNLEVIFRPDPTVWDGEFANNGWLQELPKPLTKLSWDNAALLSPTTARRLGVATEDVVDITLKGRSVRAPVWIQPGHADDCVTIPLGYGRTRVGSVGRGTGFNGYRLRSSAAPLFERGAEIRKTGERYPLATTQHHGSMDGRALVRAASLSEFQKHPKFAQEMGEAPAEAMTLYPGFPRGETAWGMSVDLSTCIGCNACVVACQAENNIPVVGKSQVIAGREMQWIRIDRYYSGESLENPRTYNEPVLCMHCENAPCEYVCPVGATVHSVDGLNEMVYNRCIGTRYCSNNCPYKVRRFNFLQYNDLKSPSLKLLRNPNVTVRTRGVMEKCTYCVQRISAARIQAEKQERSIRDGEVRTACQQACPAEAIVFGNIADTESRVAKLKAEPLDYGLLAELNTRPRTSYLAKIWNPNPELEREG
jgi:molybdopterin-containing oxidoreductase family iron-sulfur binding subunit